MKILFCNLFISLTSNTIVRYLTNMGHTCIERTYYTPESLYEDRKIDDMIIKDIKANRPETVFSINFWPPIARACKKENVKYISYGYDSPQNIPKSDDMEYETNYIFLFDMEEVNAYVKRGIDRVFHMTLATDVENWDRVKRNKNKKYDISLIGKIYESTLPMLMSAMDDYLTGYFNAVIASQQKIYGYYMVDELITDEILADANKCFRKKESNANVTKRQLSYSVGSYVTYLDRVTLLRLLQVAGEIHLFTENLSKDGECLLKDVNIHGKVSYEEEMPVIFKSSKINLNPVLRVIKTGIPQRALDVIGCNAFLLSSFQPELAEYFIPNEEVVMYDSYEDALEKADFYLGHDEIREKISSAGYEKIKKYFTYEVKLNEMLKMAGLL